jgi:hypothetical protein
LTERQRAILELERTWWTMDEEKELLIRRRFACALDVYYQELNATLDDPDALDADPLVVHRLRRARERERRARIENLGTRTTEGGRT